MNDLPILNMLALALGGRVMYRFEFENGGKRSAQIPSFYNDKLVIVLLYKFLNKSRAQDFARVVQHKENDFNHDIFHIVIKDGPPGHVLKTPAEKKYFRPTGVTDTGPRFYVVELRMV